MGWLWSSVDHPSDPPPTSPPKDNNALDESLALALAQAQTHPSSDEPTPLASTHPALPQTRDEVANAELLAFLENLEKSEPPPTIHTPLSALASVISSSAPPVDFSDLADHSDPASAAARRLTPLNTHSTTISCRAAFDNAFHCQSLGGQFAHVYRYGTVRSCSSQWSQFWFCVKTNSRRMSEEQRAQKVLRKAMEMERKYRTGPSSEDVWSQREVLLQGAFEGDLDAVEREEGRRWGDGKRGDGGGSGELSERFGKA